MRSCGKDDVQPSPQLASEPIKGILFTSFRRQLIENKWKCAKQLTKLFEWQKSNVHTVEVMRDVIPCQFSKIPLQSKSTLASPLVDN